MLHKVPEHQRESRRRISYCGNNSKFLIIGILLYCVIFLACQPDRPANLALKVNSQSATQSPTGTPTVIPTLLPSPPRGEGEKEGEYEGFHYYYKTEGDTTVALFAKRFLPRDDTIVVGAIRDVIRRVYQEKTSGAPYLVDSGSSGKAIRIDGIKNGYLVVPIKEDTGEIHSLTIKRVAR
jgi:hypothetical protein